jgi:hypothetical protein
MVCVLVPPLLMRNMRVLFGALRSPRSNASFFTFLWLCNYIIGIIYIYYHYISVTPNFL